MKRYNDDDDAVVTNPGSRSRIRNMIRISAQNLSHSSPTPKGHSVSIQIISTESVHNLSSTNTYTETMDKQDKKHNLFG